MNQCSYYDIMDVIPPQRPSAGACLETDLVALLGEDIIARLKALKVTLIGVGGIGCELLKVWQW